MKKCIRSKTLWINIIAISAIIAQCKFGFVVNPELQVTILGIVNLILRTITNEGLE